MDVLQVADLADALRVWELETGQLVINFVADYPTIACGVSPDGTTFVAGDSSGRVQLLRLELE